MRIGMVLARYPAGYRSPVFPEVAACLQRRGADVELIHPDADVLALTAPIPAHDLYVLKCRSEMALGLAGALHVAGACIVNPYPISLVCRDKLATTQVLQGAGVPVPDTYATNDPARLAPLLAAGPLIVKPATGSRGRGVVLAHRPEDLPALADGDTTVIAQRYLPPDGLDRKLYCIGGEVFGVLRRWPARTYEDKLGEPFIVDGDLRAITLAAGEAMGLDLFGLDIVVSDGRPSIIDFSAFPGFKGVPGAAERLADYLFAVACEGERRQVAAGG